MQLKDDWDTYVWSIFQIGLADVFILLFKLSELVTSINSILDLMSPNRLEENFTIDSLGTYFPL